MARLSGNLLNCLIGPLLCPFSTSVPSALYQGQKAMITPLLNFSNSAQNRKRSILNHKKKEIMVTAIQMAFLLLWRIRANWMPHIAAASPVASASQRFLSPMRCALKQPQSQHLELFYNSLNLTFPAECSLCCVRSSRVSQTDLGSSAGLFTGRRERRSPTQSTA